MKGELVSVITEDKVRLDGFYCESGGQSSLDVDAAIITHGLSGNFYQSRLLKHFAHELLSSGTNALLINTRGHDYLNSTPRMGRATTLGAAVEIIDECKFDLFAWVDFLRTRGHKNVMLAGHSLGAIKSLYAQAHHPHPNVTRLAAFSATKLSYDSLMESSGGDRFVDWLTTSQQWVAEERGDQLMFVDFPFPTWISASAYLNKYGGGDKYSWLSFIEQIKIPTLAVFGAREMEENPAFKVMRIDLDNIQQANVSVRYIPNADHFYTACFTESSSALIEWLKNLR